MSHRFTATFLRKVSNSTELTYTLNKAVAALGRAGIPSLVVGGYAVQERGYSRFTADLDILVPDVAEARSQLSISGFKENPGSSMTVTDRSTKVEIDLLPAGGTVGPGPLPLPKMLYATEVPVMADLRTLLEMKLSSYMGSPARRVKDLADATELIMANELDETFQIATEVQGTYMNIVEDLWNERV